MRVLIVTGMSIPITDLTTGLKEHKTSGAWVGINASRLALDNRISKIGIISVTPKADNGYEAEGKFIIYNIKAYIMKNRISNKLDTQLIDIIKDFGPDIIDVQGIEFPMFTYFALRSFSCPTVYTLQGFPSAINRALAGSVDYYEKKKLNSFVSLLTGRSLSLTCYRLRKREIFSEQIISNGKFFIGHTDWDQSMVESVNRNAYYYRSNRSLRDEFYKSKKWSLSNCNLHSVFTIQGFTPAKGLHIILKASILLIQKYKDFKLYIPGISWDDIIQSRNPYFRILWDMIVCNNMKSHIEFLGKLNASQIIEYQRKSHVFVSPSMQENSPNSLAEAQYLGVPAVVSAVGGSLDYVQDRVTGFLYDSIDHVMCANRISLLFDNNAVSNNLSRNEIIIAEKRHDISVNNEELINAYKSIIGVYKGDLQ